MKNQIINVMNKLFAFIALTMILTVAAFAQMPTAETKSREQLNELLLSRRGKIETGSKIDIAAETTTLRKGGAILSNQEYFNLGKDFAMAMFDASGLEDYEEALNYTIIDLVYLIDRLEGQPEAGRLQKTLKSVVRGTITAMQTRKEIETASKTYFERQRADQKWYLSAGHTTVNLSISTYFGEDAAIKKGLEELQTLIKTAPQGTAKEVLEPMNVLAKYAAKTTFTEEDYLAIFEGIGEVMEIISA